MVWQNGEEIEWNRDLQAREMNGIIADIQKFDKEIKCQDIDG